MSTPPRPTEASLQDRNGCLTAAGLLAFRTAAAGQAPTALAVHLVACARCQQRALSVDAPRTSAGRRAPRAVAPPLGRTLFLAALVLAAIRAALFTLRRLAG